MHEETLERLVSVLKSVFGSRFLGLIVYGSSHSGEYHKGYSDINTVALVSSVTAGDIAAAGRELKWFLYHGNPAPLIFTKEELVSYKDVFPIEMLDMIHQHKVVFGSDPLENQTVDKKHLGFQCESELKSKLIGLRQSLFANHTTGKLSAVLLKSLSGIVALFRGILALRGADIPVAKSDIIQKTAQIVGFEPAPFLNILAAREGKRKLAKKEIFRTFEMYVDGIARAAEFAAGSMTKPGNGKE